MPNELVAARKPSLRCHSTRLLRDRSTERVAIPLNSSRSTPISADAPSLQSPKARAPFQKNESFVPCPIQKCQDDQSQHVFHAILRTGFVRSSLPLLTGISAVSADQRPRHERAIIR